jgi:hypothetical protein
MELSISSEEMIERIEWPLLDCIQDFHFAYVPIGCDVAGYRMRFAQELAGKRGGMYDLDRNGLKFLPLVSDQDLLSRAPRYNVVLALLSPAQTKFGTAARFVAALTRDAIRNGVFDEELFALVAIGHDGNDRVAFGLMKEANSRLVEAGLPAISYLFLVAAETQSAVFDGRTEEYTRELDRLEHDYAQYHRISETFEFNKTVNVFNNTTKVPHATRGKRTCRSMVVRIPV